MLKPGDKAPSFKLASTGGGEVSSSDLKGRKFVLYFYPKDDTPGCTREACDFRDNLARLRREGVEVLGVSRDSIASHGRFRSKYQLPFDLLSDEDNAVARAYGAYGEKTMYGKKILGTIRSTYLIDESGRVDARLVAGEGRWPRGPRSRAPPWRGAIRGSRQEESLEKEVDRFKKEGGPGNRSPFSSRNAIGLPLPEVADARHERVVVLDLAELAT